MPDSCVALRSARINVMADNLQHTFSSQRASRTRKGQNHRGQLVFSQLICQFGPQTSEHVTVDVRDESRQRSGRSQDRSLHHPPPPGLRTQMAWDVWPRTRGLPAGRAAVCPATHSELMWHGYYAARKKRPDCVLIPLSLCTALQATFIFCHSLNSLVSKFFSLT